MKNALICFYCLFLFLLAGCTFDYGEKESGGEEMPDLIMENVEYVRVRSADPLARIRAEHVERYEKQSLIKIENLIFEQYGERGKKVNVHGKAGYAKVEIETGDIFMDRGVNIEVEAEDIILETYQLEWKDEPKTISSGDNNEVFVYRNNGTRFTGRGLNGNVKMRTWEFLGSAAGIYVHNDNTEE